MIASDERDFDEIAIGALAMNEYHGLLRSGLKLEEHVAGEAHVESGQFDDSVISSESDDVIKEDISITFQRAKAVSAFFLVQRIASVTKVQSANGKIFLLSDFASVPKPIVMTRVAIAPFAGIEAHSQKTAFAFP